MGLQKTSDHIQIKIKMPNPSQEPPSSSKAQNQDFKNMDVLCTFKIKIENKNSDHRCTKDQIKIQMQNSSQEPPVSSKVPYQDLKDIDVLCIFKIKMESQNSEYGWNKDQWPYPYQYQDAKAQSWTSSIFQSRNQDLKDMDVLCTFKIKIESQNSEYGWTKD